MNFCNRKSLTFLFCILNLSLYAEGKVEKKGYDIGPCLYPYEKFSKNCCENKCCDPCKNPAHLYAGGEWLYWKSQEDNLRAGTLIDVTVVDGAQVGTFTIIEPTFNFTEGMRVYAGFQFPCNYWDLSTSYTFLPLVSKPVTATLSTEDPDHQQFLFPDETNFPIFEAFDTPSYQSLSSSWCGNLSIVDGDLARKLSFCNRFFFTPHFGFRYLTCDQRILMQGEFISPAPDGSMFSKLLFYNDLDAYGVEGGFRADWHLGCGFSIFGHAGGSLLSSFYSGKIFAQSYVDPADAPVFQLSGGLDFITVTPTLDYFVGIDFTFGSPFFSISAYAGWEQWVFFGLNRMATMGGNLTTQGVTAGITLVL